MYSVVAHYFQVANLRQFTGFVQSL